MFALIGVGGVYEWFSTKFIDGLPGTASDSDRQLGLSIVKHRLVKWYQEELDEALANIHKPLQLRMRRADNNAIRVVFAGGRVADSSDSLSVEELAQHISESTPCALLRGAGGSDKSTLLRQLSLLILRTDQAAVVSRLPFVLNLSEWSRIKYKDFEEWLFVGLEKYYRVRSDLGRLLFDQCQVMLLLDGLEGVENSARADLLSSVEEFRRRRGLLPIIMVCRSDDYELSRSPILFDHVFDLELPSHEEATNFLSILDNPVAEAALRVSRRDKTWWNLLRTPLVLSLIARIGVLNPSARVVSSGSRKRRLNHLINIYITEMLKCKKLPYVSFAGNEVRVSLAWLAAKMKAAERSDLTADRFELSWIEDGSPTRRVTYIPAFSFVPLAMLSIIGMLPPLTSIIPGVNGLQLSFIFASSTPYVIYWLNFKTAMTSNIYKSKAISPVTRIRFSFTHVENLLLAVLLGITIVFVIYRNNHDSITVSWLAVGVTVTSMYLLGTLLTSTEIASDDDGRAPLELLRRSRRIAWTWSLPISLGTAFIAIAIHWYANELPTGLIAGGILFIGLWALLWVPFGGGAWLQYRGCNRILQRKGVIPCTIDELLSFAVASLIMARLGTSFRFVHQWIQDYLAAEYELLQSQGASDTSHRPT